MIIPLICSAIGAVLGGYCALLLKEHGAAAAPPVVRAERFELVTKDGKTLAIWGKAQDGNVVTAFLDSTGKVRAEFGVTPDGGVQWIRMYGPDGQQVARFGTDGYSAGTLSLGDEERSARILLGSIPGDVPARSESWGLVFPRKGGFSNWIEIGVRDRGSSDDVSAMMSLSGASGVRWTAPLSR
ncbi:hypothetical protein [Paludibaculum fermentans]|uniref:hypothetical protein n=1 Tax=Paludibaculum fermentans TaxID=1473598 RepID=UPI003EC0DDAB